MGMISGSGGNCENLHFNGRLLYYTICSNNMQPNKIVIIPSTTVNRTQKPLLKSLLIVIPRRGMTRRNLRICRRRAVTNKFF